MNNIENFKLLYINVIKIYLLNFSEKKAKKWKIIDITIIFLYCTIYIKSTIWIIKNINIVEKDWTRVLTKNYHNNCF